MSHLDGLYKKYGRPRLVPTHITISQFEVGIEFEDDEFPKDIIPVFPSEALIFEDFNEPTSFKISGRFITNLLPSTSKIMMSIRFKAKGETEERPIVDDSVITTKDDFDYSGDDAGVDLAGSINELLVPGEGLLTFNLIFFIDDPDIWEEEFPLVNTICAIPTLLFKQGGKKDG